MKRSDAALTFALCASLAVHALVGGLFLRERIAELTRQLVWPALPDAVARVPEDEAEEFAAADPPILRPPSPPELALLRPQLPPPPQPPLPKKKDVSDENSEWGEKGAKGFAITSAPGKVPMSAREGIEDQAFASRDPEGAAREFPEDPSMSVLPPGQNGDGGKPNPLAHKGTEGNPAEALKPPVEMPPPPPTPVNRNAVATALDPSSAPQTSGRSTSEMPAPEQRSPAEDNAPPAQRAGLANDAAYGESNQLLPIKTSDIIGVRTNDPAYPEIVEALTRPPGLKLTPRRDEFSDAFALANIATADVTASAPIQPATAALALPQRPLEEMAQLLGTADPLNRPAVVEAMTHLPDEQSIEGGDAALPELALADQAAASEVQAAIVGLLFERRPDDELAERLEVRVEANVATATNKPPTPLPSNATGGLPNPSIAAADPAPDTGLESDPFAKIPGIQFRNGKVEARSGRQVKTIRPHLSEAGRRDLLAMQFPTVTYKVRIDKTGKVIDVAVVRGSGSEAIDMPVYRALWNWWFEPPTDKRGNPLEDVQLVSIHWG